MKTVYPPQAKFGGGGGGIIMKTVYPPQTKFAGGIIMKILTSPIRDSSFFQ